jgi:aryl-alcohol dehydrogenase-like predicted oxidoreductase
MEYTTLGASGLTVSRICLGMMSYGDPRWREWVLGRDQAEPIVKMALDNGVTFFDTANAYSYGVSEEITGELLARHARRDEIVVATKVFFPDREGATDNEHGLSRKSILSAIDRSLTRLGMDYVDLYQIHRFDQRVPIEETMGSLHEIVVTGKARYVGASSMWAWQFARMQEAARSNGWTEFVSMQNQYSLLYREEEREMIPLCLAEGVGLIPWSPLARGRLARPPSRFTNGGTTRADSDEIQQAFYKEADVGIVEAVASVAGELGVEQSQVALAWLLAKPGIVAPIVGATKLEHLDAALGALEVTIDDNQIRLLEEGYRPIPILDH